MGLDMTVNRLPARTWNWLKMNESSLKEIEAFGSPEVEFSGKCTDVEWDGFETIATGMGEDMDRLANVSGATTIRLTGGESKLHIACTDGQKNFQKVEILAEEGECVNVVMDYTSAKEAGGLLAVQTKMRLAKNATVRLVQVQTLGDGFTLLNDVGALCADGAKVEILQLFLGAAKTYSGVLSDLLGEASSLDAKVGYLGRNEQRVDMNYVALHKGKKTVSKMTADGVLRDRAFKLFRGTIDFKNGASGAEGEEREDVLLLGDDVINQTIPLILCAEEDVQGNHGATIGQLDEETLFYLCSRGMSEEAATNLISRARIDALCAKIGDEAVQTQVQNYLEEVLGNE